MCFENLPVAFDDQGRPRLVDGGSFAVERVPPSPLRDASAGTRGAVEFNIDPVTRVAGALAFHTRVDLAGGTVTDAHAEAIDQVIACREGNGTNRLTAASVLDALALTLDVHHVLTAEQPSLS